MAKRKGTEGQATQWPKEKGQKDEQRNGQKKRDRRTSNTMTKRKGTEGQATKLPTEKESRTNNTITNRKGKQNKQHNGQKKMTDGQATQ
jgi:hypothetical protein